MMPAKARNPVIAVIQPVMATMRTQRCPDTQQARHTQ